MPFNNQKILVIDDTLSIRSFLRISLEAQGAEFFEAASAEAGFNCCMQVKPDIVILDLGLPDKDGLELLPEIKKQALTGAQVPRVIILSVRREQKTKNQAYALGADAYVTKPFLMDELLDVIQEQLEVAG